MYIHTCIVYIYIYIYIYILLYSIYIYIYVYTYMYSILYVVVFSIPFDIYPCIPIVPHFRMFLIEACRIFGVNHPHVVRFHWQGEQWASQSKSKRSFISTGGQAGLHVHLHADRAPDLAKLPNINVH